MWTGPQVGGKSGAREYSNSFSRLLCTCNPLWSKLIALRLALSTTGMAEMIIKRGLLQIVLAALLLVAQHCALSHQIRHLQHNLPSQSQQQDGGKQKALSGLCDFHVAFAEVLGAVDSFAPPLRIAANVVEHGINYFPPAFPSDLVVPASRGPPILL